MMVHSFDGGGTMFISSRLLIQDSHICQATQYLESFWYIKKKEEKKNSN